jgi:hypothetical protein
MYYRIEYKRLYDTRRLMVVCICDTLCHEEAEKFDFDINAAFCFHEAEFDPECSNCITRHKQEKP